jgi:hypothetical protein
MGGAFLRLIFGRNGSELYRRKGLSGKRRNYGRDVGLLHWDRSQDPDQKEGARQTYLQNNKYKTVKIP